MKNLLLALSFGLLSAHSMAGHWLYLGDSHSYLATMAPAENSQRLGHVLIAGLEAQGHQISYYAACGSEPGDWVRGSSTTCGYTARVGSSFQAPRSASFPALTSIYRPSEHAMIVINLGDNMFNWRQVGNKRVASVNTAGATQVMNAFMRVIPNATLANCVWIGPTYHLEGSTYLKPDASVDQLYAVLEATLASKCRLIDARPMVVPVIPNDGLHHVNADSQAWGHGILSVL